MGHNCIRLRVFDVPELAWATAFLPAGSCGPQFPMQPIRGARVPSTRFRIKRYRSLRARHERRARRKTDGLDVRQLGQVVRAASTRLDAWPCRAQNTDWQATARPLPQKSVSISLEEVARAVACRPTRAGLAISTGRDHPDAAGADETCAADRLHAFRRSGHASGDLEPGVVCASCSLQESFGPHVTYTGGLGCCAVH